MLNKKSYLYSFLALSLVVFNTDVIAQDDDNVEEVVVTGSKITKDEFSSSSPITIITEEDILNAGNASVDEYLKYTPAFTGYQLGTSTNNGGDGSRKVDLRGLGFNRTLVLVNGKRTIGDIGGDGAVDIGGIPEMMIKRVEVLKDGASTIYGSDAISGVVNFILDDKFTGLKVQAGMGEGTENGQARDESVGMMAGIGGDNGNVVFSASWKNQKEMLQAEQPWANDALYPQIQSDGTFKSVGSGSSNSRKIRGPGGNFIYDSSIGAARPFTAADVYNYAPVNALITPNERTQMGVLGTLEVTDNVEMYFSGIYNRRYSHQRLAPDASFAVNPAVETPNNGAQYNDWVPANNPYNPFGSVNCSNTVGICDVAVRINRRFEESGGRIFEQTVDAYSIVTGFRFEAMGWNHDISMTFGETEQVDETLNYGRFDRWATAVDPVACAANSSCPGVLNPFGEFGSISAEQMSFLTAGSLKDQSGADFEMISWVVSNDMFAFGIEKRQEYGYFKPDEFSAEGLTTGGASSPLRGGFSVTEAFGEYLAKVSDELTVDMSVRYSDYDTVGDTTNFKIGADYVLSEDVRLRAAYGTGFRAPNVSELNTDASTTFPVIDLPCELGDRRLAAGAISQTIHSNCQALGYDTSDAGEYGFAWQSYHEYYADGQLAPEESTNLSFGAVIDSDMLGGVQMSVDYFNIEIEKVIALPIANLIFLDCLSQQNMDFSTGSCGLFIDYGLNDSSSFGPNGLQYFGYPGDIETPWGNQGTFTSDGIDFALSTSGDLDMGAVSGYSVNFDATWHNSYEQEFTYGGGRDYVGSADGFAVYPELRYVLSLGVNGDAWNAFWNIRFVSESDDVWRHPSVTADAVAEATTYHDISTSYDFGNTVLRFGVNNLTDEKPPYFHSNFNGNTEPGVYDVIGRRMFMSVTATF
jgi:iron complex outermembrane receptor protein